MSSSQVSNSDHEFFAAVATAQQPTRVESFWLRENDQPIEALTKDIKCSAHVGEYTPICELEQLP